MFKRPGRLGQKPRFFGTAVLLLCAATAGCEKKQPAPDKPTPPPSSDPTSNAGLPGMPGEDRQATLDYLNNGIRFDPGEMPDDSSYEADLDCNNQCGGPAKLTLRVYPERNSHKVNWEEAINGSTNRGYILAKMVNSSDKDFGPLGLKAGGSIYQWIGPTEANAKRRRVAWVTIDPATGEAEPFRMKKARIRLCAVDGWEKRTKPALKSWNSVTHGRCRFVRANLDEDETESDPILEPQYPPDMWDGCPGGCCQGQN